MKKTAALCLAVLAGLAAPMMSAHAGVRIGIGIGGPMYYGPRPYYGYGYGYGYGSPYYYGPGYVVPPPIVYQAPPPIVYQAAPPPLVYQTPPNVVRSAPPASEPIPLPPPPPPVGNVQPAALNVAPNQGQIGPMLQRLADPSDTARRDAALDLGRMKAQDAVDPLLAVLAKDPSAIARDGAARSLGLIASPRSLNALIYAAQADSDREVRHSAQFAVEVIRNHLRGQ